MQLGLLQMSSASFGFKPFVCCLPKRAPAGGGIAANRILTLH
jgi:hypothetical protein